MPESKSRIVGFAWLWMHLTLTKLNGLMLTRHLWFSFQVSKKRFYFITILSSVSFEVCYNGMPLTLSSALLLLFLLFSYYCYYDYYYYCCCCCYCVIVIVNFIIFFRFLTCKSNIRIFVWSAATTLPLLFLEEEDLEQILLYLLLLPFFLLLLLLLLFLSF